MKTLLAFFCALLLAGCTQSSLTRYTFNEPAFDPLEFFNGPIRAEGVVLDRGGALQRYFTAEISARWDEKTGTLDEHFVWDNGERQHRLWQFERRGDNHWAGTAGDVVGEAHLRYAGNVLHMTYPLEVPLEDDTLVLKMDDWLFQVTESVIINRTKMTKFGLRVGEVILTLRKVPKADDNQYNQ